MRPLEKRETAEPENIGLELDSLRAVTDEPCYGVPVICLGNPVQSGTGLQLLADLAPAGCRILLVNLPNSTWPGRGSVEQEDLQQALDRAVDLLAGYLHECEFRKAILLGAEFGAAVAIAFVVRHPELVSGLILCQPLGVVAPRLAWQLWAGERRVDALQTAHAAYTALAQRLRAGLKEITCPVLAVISKSNRTTPLHPLRQLFAELDTGQSRLRIAVFSGRRSPLVDDPERMVRVVSGFAAAALPLVQHRHAWTLAQTDWPARGLNQWRCTHPECHAELAVPVGENPESGD